MVALEERQPDIARVLIEYGALILDVSVSLYNINTPYMYNLAFLMYVC
jgi:hypothetical protein